MNYVQSSNPRGLYDLFYDTICRNRVQKLQSLINQIFSNHMRQEQFFSAMYWLHIALYNSRIHALPSTIDTANRKMRTIVYHPATTNERLNRTTPAQLDVQ